MLTSLEVLKQLKKSGYKVNYSTFQFYQKIGLLPLPKKIPVKKGRGMRNVYDSDLTIKHVKYIKYQQSLGRSLADIGGDRIFSKVRDYCHCCGARRFLMPCSKGKKKPGGGRKK